MSRSNDAGHFFQTDSALSESARRAEKAKNTRGNPVVLPSKILAVAAEPEDGGVVWVAEAAGTVKRIGLPLEGEIEAGDSKTAKANANGQILATYTGPTAPLTSLALSPHLSTVFAGCWDKSIWSWDLASKKPKHRFQGHADFVKAILAVRLAGGRELLVSGSQDATIMVWDAATGARLHTLKGHTRGVLALALDPSEYDPAKDEAIIFSAGSDREIRRWKISVASAKEIKDNPPAPILVHETSVDALRFDADADMWTASADKTAKCLSRARNWDQDSEFEHPDYVRDVVVDEEGGWVITACRDEEVRVFDRASGTLHHVFSGHYEEVTALVLLPGQKVVSVSIDGTVRVWSLRAGDLARAMKEAEDERGGKAEEVEEERKEGLMTAEEEAELAALMEDSE